MIERLIDRAADQLELDPIALRRRNIIPNSAQPYANPLGLVYDSGRYEEAMDTALALAGWNGFRPDAPRLGDAASGAGSALPTMSKSPAARHVSAPKSRCFPKAGSSW